jgi:hypothetical protein
MLPRPASLTTSKPHQPLSSRNQLPRPSPDGYAEKAAVAKDRLDRLAKGEDVLGGLGKPADFEKVLMDAGSSRDDINFSIALAGLSEGEFDAFLELGLKLQDREEKSSRWKVLRKVRATRGG